jgi:c-di-GMP-binding flagellar brake protein YcgR
VANDRLDGTTLDLSLGGSLVQARGAFPPGSLATVNLELGDGKSLMRSVARVIRIVGTDCMGIQFESLAPEESVRLQEFLLPMILAAS